MVRYQQGEYEAFSELYARHSGKVYAYLKRHLPSQNQSADDLLQASFLKLHEHRAKYDPKYPFLAWLFSITRNNMIDALRRKNATPTESAELERMAQGQAVIEDVSRESDVEAALSGLPAAQRNLIQMRFKDGLSFEEISNRLGESQATIRKRISRTVQGLRKVLGSTRGEE